MEARTLAFIVLGLFVATAVLGAVSAPANAHACNAATCGPCKDGENHQHNGGDGQCVSSPGFEALAGLAAVAGVAWQRRRKA